MRRRITGLEIASLVISIVSIITVVLLGIEVYYQSERINALGKGVLANDVIISSGQMDTTWRPADVVNVSIDITSNYDGAMPISIQLLEVSNDAKKVASGYSHNWNGKTEDIVFKDGDIHFNCTFSSNVPGEYELLFLINYNYKQGALAETGTSKTYTLNIYYAE